MQGYEAQYPAGLDFQGLLNLKSFPELALLMNNFRLALTVCRKAGRPVCKRKESVHELRQQKRAQSKTCALSATERGTPTRSAHTFWLLREDDC